MAPNLCRLLTLLFAVYGQQPEGCPDECTVELRTNGVCDLECYTSECGWDNSACSQEQCVEGCLDVWKGNGICEAGCNVPACDFDDGDCNCAPNCSPDMEQNGVCDTECRFAECNFDNADCNAECSAGCFRSQIDDGTCDVNCQTTSCNNDGLDCKNEWEQAGCISGFVNDGVCQEVCNIRVCDFDFPDCAVMPAPFKTYTLRKLADEDEDIEEKNAGLVLGVGIGVFFIILGCIIGFFLCVIGLATNIFLVCLIIGIAIPLIIFLIVAFAPKHSDVEEEDDDRTDEFMVPRIIFLVILMVSALLALFKITDFYFGVNLAARRVESKVDDRALADEIDPQFSGQEEGEEGQVEARAQEELVNPNERALPVAPGSANSDNTSN